MATREDKFQQHKISDMFAKRPPGAGADADMEDFGRIRSENPATRHLARVTRKDPKSRGAVADEEAESEEPLPDGTVDYPGWIRVMRKRWRKQREERRLAMASGGQAPTAADRGSLSSMFRQRTFGMSSMAWEIVQVAPSTRPGVFNLWLSIDNHFQKVKLRIPRQFYLNLRTPPGRKTFLPQYRAEALVRTLPRNHPCHNLFRITVDEDLYVEGQTHFSSLINNPNVDGVYELQVSLVSLSGRGSASLTLFSLGPSRRPGPPRSWYVVRPRELGCWWPQSRPRSRLRSRRP